MRRVGSDRGRISARRLTVAFGSVRTSRNHGPPVLSALPRSIRQQPCLVSRLTLRSAIVAYGRPAKAPANTPSEGTQLTIVAAGRPGQGGREHRSERAQTPVSEERSGQRSHGRSGATAGSLASDNERPGSADGPGLITLARRASRGLAPRGWV